MVVLELVSASRASVVRNCAAHIVAIIAACYHHLSCGYWVLLRRAVSSDCCLRVRKCVVECVQLLDTLGCTLAAAGALVLADARSLPPAKISIRLPLPVEILTRPCELDAAMHVQHNLCVNHRIASGLPYLRARTHRYSSVCTHEPLIR